MTLRVHTTGTLASIWLMKHGAMDVKSSVNSFFVYCVFICDGHTLYSLANFVSREMSVLEFLKSLWGPGTEGEYGYRTGPPGYIGWRNSFLGINSGAPYTFKKTGSGVELREMQRSMEDTHATNLASHLPI